MVPLAAAGGSPDSGGVDLVAASGLPASFGGGVVPCSDMLEEENRCGAPPFASWHYFASSF